MFLLSGLLGLCQVTTVCSDISCCSLKPKAIFQVLWALPNHRESWVCGLLLTSDVVRITHQKGHWMPGPLRTGERSKISLFRGEAWSGLQANHQRITNRAYVTKNRLVFRQTSKETIESLAPEGPRQGKNVAGLP
jgi:hypothetical protein